MPTPSPTDFRITVTARVERGTAEFCSCGGWLRPVYMRGGIQWFCGSCGKGYE